MTAATLCCLLLLVALAAAQCNFAAPAARSNSEVAMSGDNYLTMLNVLPCNVNGTSGGWWAMVSASGVSFKYGPNAAAVAASPVVPFLPDAASLPRVPHVQVYSTIEGNIGSIGMADLNLDTMSDLILLGANGIYVKANGGFVGDYYARTGTPSYYGPAAPRGRRLVDMDADGDLDLLLWVNVANERAAWMRNSLQDGSFDPPITVLLPAVGARVVGIDCTPLDTDSDVDCAIVVASPPQVLVLRDTSGAGLAYSSTVIDGAITTADADILVVELTGDALKDLIVFSRTGSGPAPVGGIFFYASTASSGISYAPRAALAVNLPTGSSRWVLADTDADLDLDIIYTLTSGGGVLRAIINQGAGSFSADAPTIAPTAVANNGAMTAGLLDGDPYPDYVFAINSATVQIFHNGGASGGLSWTLNQSVVALNPTDSSASAVKLLDCNGDGRLDLIVSNNIQLTVFYKRLFPGGWFFDTAGDDVATNGIGSGLGVEIAAGFVTADAVVDFVGSLVANTTLEHTFVRRSTLGAGFTGRLVFGPSVRLGFNGASFGGGGEPMLGDFDGDGDVDVAYGVPLSTVVMWVKNLHVENVVVAGGPLVFGGNTTIGTSTIAFAQPRGALVADVSGDGWVDIVMPEATGSATVILFTNLGTGTGTFSQSTLMTGCAAGARTVSQADMDGDADLDLLLQCNGPTVLVRTGPGVSFAAPLTLAVPNLIGANVLGVIAVQANTWQDNLMDLAFAVSTPSPPSSFLAVALRQGAALTATGWSNARTGVTAGGGQLNAPRPVVWKNDRFGDFLYSRVGASNPHIRQTFDPMWSFENDFMPFSPTCCASNSPYVVLLDIDSDGDIDQVTPDVGSSNWRVRLNQGNFRTLFQVATPASSFSVAPSTGGGVAADLNADGYMDALVTLPSVNTVAWMANTPPPPPSPPGPPPAPTASTVFFAPAVALPGAIDTPANALYAIDANRDGLVDVVALARGFERSVVWWRATDLYGNFAFKARVFNATTFVSMGSRLLAQDLDADGIVDYVVSAVAPGPAAKIHFFLGLLDGPSGNISASAVPSLSVDTMGYGATWYELADINGDSVLDLLFSIGTGGNMTGGPLVYLLGAAPLVFGPPMPVPAGGVLGLNAFALGDINRDGLLDIAMAPSTSGPLQLLANLGVEGGGVGGSMFVPKSNATAVSIGMTFNDFSIFNALQLVDLNGDALLDIVAVQAASPTPVAPRVYFADNSYASLPWEASMLPRTTVVDVRACGYTVACIKEAVARAIAACESPAPLPAGVWAARRVLLPAGVYTGCLRDTGYQIPRDIWIQGAGRAQTRIQCEPFVLSGGTDGRYVFRVRAGVRATITDMTITGAYTGQTTFGGAALSVSESGSLLRLVNVEVANCTSAKTSQISVRSPLQGFGAAVLVLDGAKFISINSSFTDLFAGYGGAAVTALGAGVTLEISNSVFTRNTAVVAGPAIFTELAVAGTLRVSVDNSVFQDCAAIADPIDVSISSLGGVMGFFTYLGSQSVNLTDVVVRRNRAEHYGGAIFVKTAFSTAVDMALVRCVMTDNFSPTFGGAIIVDAYDLSYVRLTVRDSRFERNTANGVGGAIALKTTSSAASPLTTSPTIRASFYGVNTLAYNSGVHGGALVADANGGSLAGAVSIVLEFAAGSLTTMANNYAAYIGGGLATLGRVTVTAAAGTLAFASNNAFAGGAFGGMGGAAYRELSGARPSASSALPPTSDAIGCGSMGALVAQAVAASGNQALYGSFGYVCESQISLGGLSVGSISVPGVGTVAGGGLFFACSNQVDRTSPAASCHIGPGPRVPGAGPSAVLSSAPWMTADAGSSLALNASYAGLLTAASYGPFVATPIVAIAWVAVPPAQLSSGAPFVKQTAVAAAEDSFGQQVVDSNAVLAMRIDPAMAGQYAELAGSSPKLLLSSATVDFVGVGIALYGTAPLGVAVTVQVVVDRIATPSSSVYFPVESAVIAIGACLPGYGVLPATSGLLQCAACQEGTFSNATTLLPCLVCPASDQLTGVGAIECFSCPVGTAPLQIELGIRPNCSCKYGFYNPAREPNKACIPCPVGGVCEGALEQPYCAPGFYPSPDGVYLECPNQRACLGGRIFRCARGYQGRLCGQCSPGFYSLSGYCYKCDNRTIPVLIAVVLLVTLVLLLLVTVNSRDDVSYRFAAVMIALNSLQITAIYGQIELAWPDFARQFYNVLSVLSFKFDLSSPECATVVKDVYMLKFWLTISLPGLVCVPFGIVFALLTAHMRFLRPHWAIITWLTPASLIESVRRTYIQVITFVYLPLAAMCFSYFQCERAKDGSYVLVAAPSRTCYDARWWQYFAAALIFGLFYGVGIPGGLWSLLTFSKRRAIAANMVLELWELRFAFLVGRFQRQFYRFDVSILLRKASVVLAMTVFQSAQTKAYVAVLFLVISLMQVIRFVPYKMLHHNITEAVCLASCASILWAGTFGKSDVQRNGIIIALVINLGAMVAGNVVDALWIWRERKAAKRDFAEAEVEAKSIRPEGLQRSSSNASLFRSEVELEPMDPVLESDLHMIMHNPSFDSATFASPMLRTAEPTNAPTLYTVDMPSGPLYPADSRARVMSDASYMDSTANLAS